MKQGYLCLSAKTRKKLYAGIKIVSLVSAVVCALYLGMVLHSFYRHRFLLHDLIISLFDDLYKNLIVLGILIFLISVLSFKLNRNLKNQPFNHSLPRTHRVWVGLSLVTLLATAICASLMSRVETVVDAEVGLRLKHGLSRYMDTPSWGSALDRIQSYLQCCGVHGPSDWYATAWIPLDRLSGHNVDYKLVQPNGRVQVPLVPTSCCRVVSAECGHKAWMETKTRSWSDIKPADLSLLHTVGCEEAIKSTVGRDFLIFKVLLLIVFILQIALVAAARLLYSSTINSVMLGRPEESAPGWLVGPRLFWGKKRYGYLQDYDDRCQNIETGEDKEDSPSQKRKWKCINKMRCRKHEKGSDTEGTESTEVGKIRFKGLKSPCLAKLKPTKCVTQLKATCSKRFRKKKNKGGEYTAIDSDSESSPDRVEMTSHLSDKHLEEKSRSPHDSLKKHSPERMRTGSDEQQYRYRVHTDTEHRPLDTGRTSVKKKISGNLIDVEEDFEHKHQLELFEAIENKLSPSSVKYSAGLRSHQSKISTSDGRRLSGNTSILEPRKHLSGVVKDFKKRRELFENAAKTESKTDSSKVETVKIAIPPPIPRSINLIDLDAVESAKSLSIGGTSGTEVTTMSSIKNEVKPRPIVLRNYPPLSPSE